MDQLKETEQLPATRAIEIFNATRAIEIFNRLPPTFQGLKLIGQND